MRTTQRSSSNIPQGSILLNGELVSEETLQKRAEPQEKKKKGKSWWMQIATQHYLWIWLLGAGGIGALVSPHFKAIDPYAPWLNELIHGNVIEQKDVEYQEFKIRQSEGSFAKARAVCRASAPEQCASLPAAESDLNDMASHLGKLEQAWQTVAYRNEVNPLCLEQGTPVYAVANRYVESERDLIRLVKGSDLRSGPVHDRLLQKLAEIAPIEQTEAAESAAGAQSGESLWPVSCPALGHH
jgi:hypothetical protein